jgi:hypothetical protein
MFPGCAGDGIATREVSIPGMYDVTPTHPPSVAEDGFDDRPEVQQLLANLRASRPELETLLRSCESHWGYEDPVYRFYHHSFKVYALQQTTATIVSALRALAPERELNESFTAIIQAGTGKTFEPEHNRRWLEVTRPIVEAFFHARYFLEMALRYGQEFEHPPVRLPSGWAALLYLYNLR